MAIRKYAWSFSVGRSSSDQTSGKLVEICFTNDDCAGLFKKSDNSGILFWVIFISRTSCCGVKTERVDVIFDGDGNAI